MDTYKTIVNTIAEPLTCLFENGKPGRLAQAISDRDFDEVLEHPGACEAMFESIWRVCNYILLTCALGMPPEKPVIRDGLTKAVIDPELESALVERGWAPVDYPELRGDDGYKYTVYTHKDYAGAWGVILAAEYAGLDVGTVATEDGNECYTMYVLRGSQ